MEVRRAVGRTDLEITLPGSLVIVEAKRGWLLPATGQLASYAPRIQAHGGGVLVTLSQASEALARSVLPSEVDGIPVVHLPWRSVLAELRSIRRSTRTDPPNAVVRDVLSSPHCSARHRQGRSTRHAPMN